jgi:hypothetical protein
MTWMDRLIVAKVLPDAYVMLDVATERCYIKKINSISMLTWPRYWRSLNTITLGDF